MAFNANNQSLRRSDILGFNGDASTTTHSAIYCYGYVTPDTAAVVEAAGYFDAAAYLNPGDVITAVMVIGGTPVLKQYVVTANNTASAGHVVIALQTATAG